MAFPGWDPMRVLAMRADLLIRLMAGRANIVRRLGEKRPDAAPGSGAWHVASVEEIERFLGKRE